MERRNLTEKQKQQFEEFKSRVSDVVPSTPYQRDIDLHSWLVARSYDVDCAVDMMRKSMAWREKSGVNHILTDWKPPEVLLKYFPRGYHGRSKAGLPLFIGCLGHFDIRGLVHSCRRTDVMKFGLYCFETGGRHVMEVSTETSTPVNQFLLLFDLEGLSVMQVAYKEGFEVFLEMTRIMEANYPEGLGNCIVINAPPVFTMAWAMVRPLLRGTTQSKIRIFGKTGWQELLMDLVDPDQLPKHWGGTLVGKDGNPYFAPEICVGGLVPEECYQSQQEVEKLVTHGTRVQVKRGSSKEHRVQVTRANTRLSWRFCTKGYDIMFGVSRETPAGSQQVQLKERVYSHLVVETGNIVCPEPADYVLEFDNTYSMFHGKEVHLEVSMSPA